MIKTWQEHAYRLLRWSERYTKFDMIYLTKGSFWVITGQMIVSVSSLLLAIAFANFVSKETYGEYKYVLSLFGIMGTLTLNGLGTAIIRSITRGNEGTLNYAFWQNIKWSFLFFTLALGTSLYYFLNNNQSVGISMLAVGSLAPFLNSSNFYSSFLIAKKDFRRNSIYFDIIGNLFPALCLFVAMIILGSPLALILTYFISSLLTGIILYIRVLRIYKPNKQIDPEAIHYGKHLSLMHIFSGLANNIDQVLLFHNLGAAQLAIYNFSTAIPNQIKGPLKGLDNLIFPRFTNRSDNEIRRDMNTKITCLFLLLLFLAIIYVLLAPSIFQWLFPSYLDSIRYSQIFVFSIIGLAFWPASTYLISHKKVREQYIINLSLSIIQIVSVFIGLIYAGVLGVIIARVVTRSAWGMANYFLYLFASDPNRHT